MIFSDMCSKTYPSRPKNSPIDAIAATADIRLGSFSASSTVARICPVAGLSREILNPSSETQMNRVFPRKKQSEANAPRKNPPKGVLFL